MFGMKPAPCVGVPAAADPPAAQIGADEFSGLMGNLGRFPVNIRVGVAVSGGADSLCLALLASRWRRSAALIVDHALRPGSDREARATSSLLASMGIEAHIMRLNELHPGPGLAARARAKRYAALAGLCFELGIVDLLVGHHHFDQLETRMMRQSAGSGGSGRAGMARIVFSDRLRIIRPLLGLHPNRLRATVTSAGLGSIRDPSNQDRHALRTQLRRLLSGPESCAILLKRDCLGDARQRREQEDQVTAELAITVEIRPEGFALVRADRLSFQALAGLLQTISGASHAPSALALSAFANGLKPGTLHGCRILPAGRHGPGWLVVREQAAIQAQRPAMLNILWDGRFRLCAIPCGPYAGRIGCVGPFAAGLRKRSDLPAAVLTTLPAFYAEPDEPPVLVPHLDQAPSAWVRFQPAHPAAGAAFISG